MRNLLILSAGADIAGCGIALKRAFDSAGSEWQARAVRRRSGRYGYPADIEWIRGARATGLEVAELYRRADVVHVMDNPQVLRLFPRGRQTIVVQHLGTRFREHPDEVSAVCREFGAIEAADDFDLLIRPDIHWLPDAIDTQTLYADRLRLYRPEVKVVRIAHAPTNREFKSTEAIVAAVDRLSRDYAIEFDIIEGVSNRECIERKARADIFVDQLALGFGMNVMEAWAMGIPVVSGVADLLVRQKMLSTFGDLPWVDATEETLYDAIRSLVRDRKMRLAYSRIGLAHVDRFHSYQAIVKRTTALYARGMRVAA